MIMDIAEQLDLWCQEHGNPSYKPLKGGRIMKRRSRSDIAKRKSSSGFGGTVGKSSGEQQSALNSMRQSTEVLEAPLPQNLEAMKVQE